MISFGLIRTFGFLGGESPHSPSPISKKNQPAALFRKLPFYLPYHVSSFSAVNLAAYNSIDLPTYQPMRGPPPKVPIYQSGNVAHRALPIYQSFNRIDNEGRTPPARYRRTVVSTYFPANRPIDKSTKLPNYQSSKILMRPLFVLPAYRPIGLGVCRSTYQFSDTHLSTY